MDPLTNGELTDEECAERAARAALGLAPRPASVVRQIVEFDGHA